MSMNMHKIFVNSCPLNKKPACAGFKVNKVFGNCFWQFLNTFLRFWGAQLNQDKLRTLETLPRDSRNSMDSIL